MGSEMCIRDRAVVAQRLGAVNRLIRSVQNAIILQPVRRSVLRGKVIGLPLNGAGLSGEGFNAEVASVLTCEAPPTEPVSIRHTDFGRKIARLKRAAEIGRKHRVALHAAVHAESVGEFRGSEAVKLEGGRAVTERSENIAAERHRAWRH